MFSEFTHYQGCKGDVENCGACALTKPVLIDGVMGINYSAWPLSYLKNNIAIPDKFFKYLANELKSDNKAYVSHLKEELKKHGYEFILKGGAK